MLFLKNERHLSFYLAELLSVEGPENHFPVSAELGRSIHIPCQTLVLCRFFAMVKSLHCDTKHHIFISEAVIFQKSGVA